MSVPRQEPWRCPQFRAGCVLQFLDFAGSACRPGKGISASGEVEMDRSSTPALCAAGRFHHSRLLRRHPCVFICCGWPCWRPVP
jgi:hypothetical protein